MTKNYVDSPEGSGTFTVDAVPTTDPLEGYKNVLNALDEMQRSKVYAVRGQVLQEAEASIVYLATALHEAREQLRQAYAGFGPLR
jgi:hypothetical protein